MVANGTAITATTPAGAEPTSNLTATGQTMSAVEVALAAITAADAVPDPDVQLKLKQIRNMWQFSALVQWLLMFKSSIKMEDDEITIEDLEKEFLGLRPLILLPKIRLNLLQSLSSQRGLRLDQFDDYTRRQYRQKAPHLEHPFGEDELPKSFEKLSVFDQVLVIHQLCEWQTFLPERFRERMGFLKESEEVTWRVDPIGTDSYDNAYYLLDDNRLYVRTYTPIVRTPKKAAKVSTPAKSKRKRRRAVTGWPSARRSKRRRTATPTPKSDEEGEEVDGGEAEIEIEAEEGAAENGVDGDEAAKAEDEEQSKEERDYSELAEFSRDGEEYTWKCVCAVYTEWKDFLADLGKKCRDKSKVAERELYNLLKSKVMPVIQSIEDERIQEEEAKLKEIEKLRIYENRKRSGRGDAIAQKRKEEEERRLELERQEQEKAQRKLERKMRAQREKEREERLKIREVKLVEAQKKKEAQLAAKQAAAEAKAAALGKTPPPKQATPVSNHAAPSTLVISAANSPARSDRHSSVDSPREPTRRSTRRAHQQSQEPQSAPTMATTTAPSSSGGGADHWYFDCYCGVFGDNYDDGELSVCCGKCDIWMHVSHLSPEETRRFEETVRAKEESGSEAAEEVKDEQDAEKVSAEGDEVVAKTEAESAPPKDEKEKEEASEEAEFVCNRCVRLEKERLLELELERKRELDRTRRRERERKREAERKRLAAEAKAKALQEQQQQQLRQQQQQQQQQQALVNGTTSLPVQTGIGNVHAVKQEAGLGVHTTLQASVPPVTSSAAAMATPTNNGMQATPVYATPGPTAPVMPQSGPGATALPPLSSLTQGDNRGVMLPPLVAGEDRLPGFPVNQVEGMALPRPVNVVTEQLPPPQPQPQPQQQPQQQQQKPVEGGHTGLDILADVMFAR
ncbi:hypothetical protein BZA70DRAFT_282325 [Myxozyma melibiosi]|uniref:Zinc finger PHD-type domain-containing protein n=1 Tax=Myxozyma melibiosi TaxID=54550 RepID=A0ABR1F206_9ASCO